jgi:hypothetical protein
MDVGLALAAATWAHSAQMPLRSRLICRGDKSTSTKRTTKVDPEFDYVNTFLQLFDIFTLGYFPDSKATWE